MSGNNTLGLKLWAELQILSNEDIIQLFRSSSYTVGKPVPEVAVCRIAKDAVVKGPVYQPSEARNVELVRSCTSIPVPAVLRDIRDSQDVDSCLVMEYIPGDTLEKLWSRLSFFRKVWVVWTLRGYVRQMRAIPHTVPWPGPVGDVPQTCTGQWFSETDAGPFATYDELMDWYSHKYDVAKRMNPVVRKNVQDAGPLSSHSPLVFTHLDLNFRNIILGEDGKLWLVDFGLSGFYPRSFESIAMFEWEALGWQGSLARRIIAGVYKQESAFFDYIWWALHVGYLM